MSMTLDEILALGNIILVSTDVDSDKSNGIFKYNRDLNVYDHYANTDYFSKMRDDQEEKLKDTDYHDNKLFLLSWTLTFSDHDAEFCSIDGNSIEGLAEAANGYLPGCMEKWADDGVISSATRPNILYVDYMNNFANNTVMSLNLRLAGE